MKKSKQLTLSDGVLIIDKNKIFVYKEKNNIYYFESNSLFLNYFMSNDFMESVSAFMKLKETFNLDVLWDIEITDDMRVITDNSRCLYWLTGGDREWKNKSIYNTEWTLASDIFLYKYNDIINDIKYRSKTLGDVRNEFLRHLNLPTLYEFSLSEGIIK